MPDNIRSPVCRGTIVVYFAFVYLLFLDNTGIFQSTFNICYHTCRCSGGYTYASPTTSWRRWRAVFTLLNEWYGERFGRPLASGRWFYGFRVGRKRCVLRLILFICFIFFEGINIKNDLIYNMSTQYIHLVSLCLYTLVTNFQIG